MEGFDVLVAIHNVLRWLVIVAAIAAIAGAWHGVVKQREWTGGDRMRTVFYVASMHLQLLLGLVLYFQSPTVQQAFDDPGWAMGETMFRYFFVEHIVTMILAVVVVQLGSILSKRTDDDAKKHKRSAICFTLGLLIVVVGLHYVWMERPLFPGL